MSNWTDEQQQAIESRNSNLLVAAAAGSGKTAVLVERIIRMICQDGLNIGNLLIVTFTNAAAGEMRERITAAIIRELESNPDNPEHLRRQLQMIGKSSICTVHAFCTNVVRDNFHLLDIDPKFRIGDTTECSILRRETVEEILEEAYESGEENFLGLVERFAGSRNDKPVEDLILRTYTFIQSQPEPLTWLKEKTGQFIMTEDELAKNAWTEIIIQDMQAKIAEARELFTAAAAAIDLDPGLEGYRSALEDDLALIDQLDTCLQTGLHSLTQRMQTIKFTRLGRVSRDCDPHLQEQVKELRNEGKKLISDLQEPMSGKSLTDYAAELLQLYPIMQSLLQLTANFIRLYQEKKAEKGILDFDDLEHFALRVLSDHEAARIYKNKYHHIFIDEYQDSNLVQETLLNYIKGEDNLFMVGDVKQSIYRFRLADPTLFISKYHAFQPEPQARNRRIDLDKNFRSRAEILAGVNYIFKHIMSEQLGEIDYDQSSFLCYGSDMEEAEDASIEVMLIEKDSNLLELDEDSEDLSEVEYEAGFAARRIKELIGQSVYDPRQKCVRPLEYRDMVILMRSTKNRADAYLDILTEQGIPAYADVGSGYFETLEIEMFLNLLRIIDNKKQDIPLLSVLRSPIGKFSVQDLIAIRLNSHAGHMYLALEEYINNIDDELSRRLSAFWTQLGKWKDKSRFMPIDQLIWEIMLETEYFYFVGAMPGGIQRQANLRILLDRARQFQASTLKGLFNFVNFIDSLQSDRGDMGNARVLGEEDNVVRIMSIHKSKGLEFPVVILAGMGKQFNLSDTSAAVLFHKDLGIGPLYVDPEARIKSNSLARMAIQSKLKKENLSEEMRILYVGCTRAINKLILLGSFKNIPGLAKKWRRSLNPYGLGKARNFMDWIGPVLMLHPDGEILRDLLEDKFDPLEIDTINSSWTISILNPVHLSAAKQETLQQQSSARSYLLDFIRESISPEHDLVNKRLDWNYPFRQAEEIPSKLSVTSVKNIQASNWPAGLPDPPVLLPGPDFIVNKTNESTFKLSGAEKGTVMHFVMQHLDLARVNSTVEIELQLQEMLEYELLSAEETNAVQIEKIERFFHSELGQRMLQSPTVYREVPFNLVCKADRVLDDIGPSDEELLVQGVIDLYFREGDELVLVDYKTDYISAQNRNALIRQYSIQINMYKEALESILQMKVKESYLYFFHTEEMIGI
jgi:ATP-dependent helicase/nuclease subunit A